MLVLVNNSLGERMRAYTLPFGLLAALAASVSSAQPLSARALLEQAAEAMGGLDRLQALDNVVLTGFGVYLNQQGGGNLSSDPRAPAKWQAANDAQRTFDSAGYVMSEFSLAGARRHLEWWHRAGSGGRPSGRRTAPSGCSWSTRRRWKRPGCRYSSAAVR